jgi:hypothetical protein
MPNISLWWIAAICALICCHADVSDKFDVVDSNHDGQISRDEFSAISSNIDSLLTIPDSIKPVLQDAGFTSGFFNALVSVRSKHSMLYINYFVVTYLKHFS